MTAPRPDEGLDDEGLDKEHKLRKRSEFLGIQRTGRRFSGQRLVLWVQKRGIVSKSAGSRLGITVSKKVGNAVIRNQIKRWIRESYRRKPWVKHEPVDLVVIAKPPAAHAGFRVLDQDLANLFSRIGRP